MSFRSPLRVMVLNPFVGSPMPKKLSSLIFMQKSLKLLPKTGMCLQ